jgi:hypothetical protein
MELQFDTSILDPNSIPVALLSKTYPYGWSNIPLAHRQDWSNQGKHAVYALAHLVSGGKGDELILAPNAALHQALRVTAAAHMGRRIQCNTSSGGQMGQHPMGGQQFYAPAQPLGSMGQQFHAPAAQPFGSSHGFLAESPESVDVEMESVDHSE